MKADIISKVSSFLGDSVVSVLKDGGNTITEEVCQIANNRVLEYLCTEYAACSEVKTMLHRSSPVQLLKIYQPLFLTTVYSREAGRTIRLMSTEVPTKKVKDIFFKSNCVTIIGAAGSGKSTLIKYLFLDAVKSKFKIPIKIELRYLNNYQGDLLKYIQEEVLKFTEIAFTDRIINRMLHSGKFVFFFDGFDEISLDRKERIAYDIIRITKKYNSCNFVLTSRPYDNVEMLESFINYYVCDLNDDEIYSFVRRQFQKTNLELAERIIETICKEESKMYKSLLRNPLLLSMFILTYEYDSNIPQRYSEYYNQVFNTLFSVHDSLSKFGYQRERRAGLDKKGYVEVLERFSFKSYFEQGFVFSRLYFDQRIEKIRADLSMEFDTEKLFQDLVVSIGILIQDGIYITYPHRSLQEYFAALYISSLAEPIKNRVYKALFSRFNDWTKPSFNNVGDVSLLILLSELDKDCFLNHFAIPTLKEAKNIISNKSLDSASIYSYDLRLSSLALSIDEQFGKDYLPVASKRSSSYGSYVELYYDNAGPNPVFHEANVFARKELVNHIIAPFLSNYDLNGVISRIREGILSRVNTDNDCVNSSLGPDFS